MNRQMSSFVGLMIMVCVCGCGRNLDKVQDGSITASSVSPNGFVEALIVAVDLGQGGAGATMSQSYQVYLRSKRPGVKEMMVVLAAEKTDGFRLRWLDQKLFICYAEAHIFRMNNQFYVSGTDHRPLDDIEVILQRVNNLTEC